jgi:ankyrin repeat protein
MEGPKNFEVCRALLKSGADITSQDIEDKTPLHTFFNNSVSSILLNHRDLVEEQVFDCYGMNILHFAAWSSSSTPAHFSRFVKEEPYLCDAPDHEGRTLIHFASERGNIALLEYLCTISNANIAPQDAKGRTPIHYAVRSKRLHSLDLLVSRGADINAVTGRGWTVLHEAVARDNVAAINRIIALLGSKAQSALEAVDHQGLNPLMLAKKCTARHAFEYLVTHQAKDTMMSSTFDDRAIESYMCSARVSKANRNRLISWDIIVVWEFLITLFVPLLLSLIIASIWAFMVRKTIL